MSINVIFVLVALLLGILLYYNNNSSSLTDETTEPSAQYDSADADGNVLIFYANWCGYCKASKQEFLDAADEGNGKIVLVNVDDSDAKPLVQRYNIKGFPTIIKVSGKSFKKYEGERTSKDIVAFLNEK